MTTTIYPLTVSNPPRAPASRIFAGMTALHHGNMNCSILCKREVVSFGGFAALPFSQPRASAFEGLVRGQFVVSFLSFNCRQMRIMKKFGLF
ncbi:hypothetical protein I3843_06G003000 [Carya illinoinensis]|nr:hypothetical protein I3843_06G003000 [Carya illinoinensis]